MRNNVPKGVDGPIQRRFRSRPDIKGLAFGFYGEWTREVDDFIAEGAKKGGVDPRAPRLLPWGGAGH